MKEGKYLITTNNWFVAPDGIEYRSAWGEVKIVEDTVLGIKTNRNSSNWYAIVGTEKNHIIIAGCQIHYAVKCEKRPNDKPAPAWVSDAQNGIKEYMQPCKIYFAE